MQYTRTLFAFALLVFGGLASCSDTAAESGERANAWSALSAEDRSQIEAQAKSGLAFVQETMAGISGEDAQAWNLAGADLRHAVLGRPIVQMELPDAAVDPLAAGAKLDDVLGFFQEIEYPVLIDGTARMVISVENGELGWLFTRVGQMSLAEGINQAYAAAGTSEIDLEHVVNVHAEAQFIRIAPGTKHERLLAASPANGDGFLGVRSGQEVSLVALAPRLREAVAQGISLAPPSVESVQALDVPASN